MDDLWHMKSCQGLNRNSSQPSPLSTSLNQFEMNPGQFGHPFVQQEVCVIERTVRQEPLGASLLNFGLQGPSIKSVRGDVGNSLLALVPGPQHQARSSYPPAVTSRPMFTSNPQAYQMGSVSSPGISSFPGHPLNMSAGNRNGGSGHGGDASLNMLGRDVNFAMLGRELNLAQYSRMAGGQECFESSLTRTSGVEMLKQNIVHDNANDITGQSLVPQWLTEIIRKQRVQNMQTSPVFAAGASFPRGAESARDGSTGTSSLPPFASSTTRGARVVCINYETGQRIGGELCLTQLGLLGVLCSCHGSHMSVAKFTQHVGIYSTNPGNVVAMDGTGESLVQWRRTLFSQYGVKVPEDIQGWDWSEGEVCESGPTKYKAVVTQSWQKEVDVSYSGEPLLKSRVTQVWDASLSPSTAPNFQSSQGLPNMGLPSSIGEGPVQDSRESILKRFGRAFQGNSMEFGSCPPAVEELEECVGRSQGAPDMQSLRNPSQLGASPSAEFFNFISGSQQFVSGHAEQQVAVERQIAVGSRSLLKGLDLAWNDRRESLQHEKDNSLSSFELRLGQPSQQSQPVGAPISTALANQMQRVMMQRVIDTGRQQTLQGTNATSAAALRTFAGHQGPSSESSFNQQNFERAGYMEPSHHSAARLDPSTGMEGNGSVLVDQSSFKRVEDVSNLRFVENLRESESILSGDSGQFSEGVRRWPTAGGVGRSLKTSDGLLMNSDHPSKRWENETQHQIGGAVRSLSQGQQDLDTILGPEWMSKSRPLDHQATGLAGPIEGREDQACRGDNMTQSRASSHPSCRGACGQDKEQFPYRDMDASTGTREEHGCACTNGGKSTTTITKGRSFSKLGEHQDFCINEVDEEGNQVEPHRQRMNRDTKQGTTHDCSSPRVRRLRSFQAITSQGCSCGGNGAEDYPIQGSRVVSLTGSGPPPPVSAVETDSAVEKRFSNADGVVAKSGLGESNNEAFQWKEVGGIFVPGSETIADATQDDMLPPRARLEEDLLADTAAKANSAVAVSSGISDKQQPVSDVCSKSSENVLSGFSDGTGADEEVSNAQSVDKNPVESEVVDEGSGIGKCSSSDGVDMGLKPNLNMSSKDDDAEKHASPSSQGYPTFSDAKDSPAAKVGTRSRVGYTVKEPAARDGEREVVVDTGKVEKKRRRTMKWKRLDAAIGAADAKRQKLSTPGILAEDFDAPQKLTEGSDISNSLGNRNLVEISPSMCGKVGIVKARKIVVTHGNRASSNAEHGMEVNVGNGMDASGTDERYLKKTETLVIRVPQGLNRKKAKRSGRSKPGKKKLAEVPQDDTIGSKLASLETSLETNTVNPAALENFKESVVNRSFIPESALLPAKYAPKHFPTLQVQPVKTGRVILGRPSPRNATRMVSINDIMNKPEVMTSTVPKDPLKPSVLRDVLNPSAHQDCSRASGVKENLRTATSKEGLKASTSKELGYPNEASLVKDSLRASALKESLKGSSPRVGLKVSTPKEALKTPAPKEGLKVKLCSSKDGFKVCSPKDGLKVSFATDGSKVSSTKDGPEVLSAKDGLKVSSPKDGLKVSSPKDGLKISSPKVGLKVPSSKDALNGSSAKVALQVSSLMDGLKQSRSKEILKGSGPIASACKDSSKAPASKSFVRIPVAVDNFKLKSFKDGSAVASTKDAPRGPVPKVDLQVPPSKDCSKGSVAKDSVKSIGAKDHLKLLSDKDVWKASRVKNGFKAAAVRDRLKASASKDASHNSFPLDMGHGSTSKDGSNPSVFKDGLKTLVHMNNSKAALKKATEGKGPRKLESGLAVVPVSKDNQDKESSFAMNAWKESKFICKSHKQEVRKVRSLYELTAKKKLPGPGAEVFEFHDEDTESPGVLKKDSCNRTSMPSESTFSVPVHFSDRKCLVPRGERSPRGKLAKMKHMFWQRHKAGSIRGNQLAAEPVEIVVGRSFVQDLRLSTGTPMAMEKEIASEVKLRPAITRMRVTQPNEKGEKNGVSPPSAHVASSTVVVKEVLDERMMDYTRARSHKRIAGQPEVVEVAIKRQKVLGSSGTSELKFGLLKTRQPFHASVPVTPIPSSSDLAGSEAKDKKIKHQTVEEDIKISGRKKRCQRPKRFDYRVPEGVVECCVCGSSVSELFNQIVCCSGCPVKVHQACYGVKKIPNGAWFCRTCKVTAEHPICVLCGYGGGAMTRAQKAQGFVKGLVKVWQVTVNTKEKADRCMPRPANFVENGGHVDLHLAEHQNLKERHELNGFSVRGNQERKVGSDISDFDSNISSHPHYIQKHEKLVCRETWAPNNTVTSGLVDATVVQWVHMVCALWMPGTRCLNFGTMGVFDVSGVAQARRKLICSICNRKGGACIQCRVVKCGIPFHAWCAHEKGLLQSENVEDGSDQVGFYGKCLRHGKDGGLLTDTADVTDVVSDVLVSRSTCARTEGYKGKLTLEERALYRRQATRNGSAAVSPEQVAAWLRINERKTCRARQFLKSANSDQKTDHREYLRFKQEHGWQRLSVYKSGIHALGLYTAEFIGRGEMVVEYIGEIVGLRVADKREADYHSGKRMQYQGACYLFRIDRERIIDATRKGGIARFVNHSCSPNCVAKVISVKNQSKVVFFAQRDIYAGEEITYDYQFNFEQEGDKIPCFCGSANCRGTLN